MTQIADRSRQAREKLALALSLLEGAAGGDIFNVVAIPVARAMGALHTIEYSRGLDLAVQGPVALACVREALEAVQTTPVSGAAEEATVHIAGSLGLVHGLSQDAEVARKLQTNAAADRVINSMALDSTRPSSTPSMKYGAPKISIPHEPSPPAPSGGLDATMPLSSAPEQSRERGHLDSTQASARAAIITQSSERRPKIDREDNARFRGDVPQSPPHAALHRTQYSQGRASPGDREQAVSTKPDPFGSSKVAAPPLAPIPEGAVVVEASLGTHSATNFYKGLSGNDVVDDGGLFIASYEIPPLGTALSLTVHMPGGYQFQALALVKWSRAAGSGGALPGYGCVFRSLSAEARQLVYRYARNREPLFHDDL